VKFVPGIETLGELEIIVHTLSLINLSFRLTLSRYGHI